MISSILFLLALLILCVGARLARSGLGFLGYWILAAIPMAGNIMFLWFMAAINDATSGSSRGADKILKWEVIGFVFASTLCAVIGLMRKAISKAGGCQQPATLTSTLSAVIDLVWKTISKAGVNQQTTNALSSQEKGWQPDLDLRKNRRW